MSYLARDPSENETGEEDTYLYSMLTRCRYSGPLPLRSREAQLERLVGDAKDGSAANIFRQGSLN